MHAKKYKKTMYFQYLLFTQTMQSTFKIVSFRGQKRLGHAQIGLLINLKFPEQSPPLSYGRLREITSLNTKIWKLKKYKLRSHRSNP